MELYTRMIKILAAALFLGTIGSVGWVFVHREALGVAVFSLGFNSIPAAVSFAVVFLAMVGSVVFLREYDDRLEIFPFPVSEWVGTSCAWKHTVILSAMMQFAGPVAFHVWFVFCSLHSDGISMLIVGAVCLTWGGGWALGLWWAEAVVGRRSGGASEGSNIISGPHWYSRCKKGVAILLFSLFLANVGGLMWYFSHGEMSVSESVGSLERFLTVFAVYGMVLIAHVCSIYLLVEADRRLRIFPFPVEEWFCADTSWKRAALLSVVVLPLGSVVLNICLVFEIIQAEFDYEFFVASIGAWWLVGFTFGQVKIRQIVRARGGGDAEDEAGGFFPW